MKAWGFFHGEGRVPSENELAAARRHVGGAHVILNPLSKTIAFDEPGVELDLGGIAKGYAVDRVVALAPTAADRRGPDQRRRQHDLRARCAARRATRGTSSSRIRSIREKSRSPSN